MTDHVTMRLTDLSLTLGELIAKVKRAEIQTGRYAVCSWITDDSPQRLITGLAVTFNLSLPEIKP